MDWQHRSIDWKQAYFTPEHPHRTLIIQALGQFVFGSVLEVGCGAGANLFRIHAQWPRVQLAGLDINPEAIRVTQEMLKGKVHTDVGTAWDIFHSDKSVDITLTDACLLYMDRRTIHRVIDEITRVTRKHVVFCEFHTSSLWERLAARRRGYYAHDYRRLLKRHGLYDIQITKIPKKTWPSDFWQRWGHIITANVV